MCIRDSLCAVYALPPFLNHSILISLYLICISEYTTLVLMSEADSDITFFVVWIILEVNASNCNAVCSYSKVQTIKSNTAYVFNILSVIMQCCYTFYKFIMPVAFMFCYFLYLYWFKFYFLIHLLYINFWCWRVPFIILLFLL